ncbi:pyridoxamine 5'-phosphate oxidase family protein [Kitasatospora sp. NPDC056273]|uniref:pyridoxamine 5'-phosphate oxidase family protein n=1 Tax=Kitasatospora sp. NPDC056273 TaxID=3345769 RepID=UPI0035E3AFE7
MPAMPAISQEPDPATGPSDTATFGKRTLVSTDPKDWVPVLKAGFVCTVAHLEISTPDDRLTIRPRCVPMVYAYHEEGGQKRLYLHGSIYYPTGIPVSLKHLWSEDGMSVSVAVALVDGLVVGRAAISTSLDYRSVVVNGTARKVDPSGRAKAFEALSDQVVPGRWGELRPIDDKDLNTDGQHMPTTGVLSVDLGEEGTTVHAKTATHPDGPEHETQRDRDYPHAWGGVLALRRTYGDPVPDKHVKPGTPVPESVQDLVKNSKAT